MTSGPTLGKGADRDGAYIDCDQVDGLIAAAGVAGAREILEAFWRSTDRLFVQLKEQIAAGDLAGAARSAHSLKGSAMNVGAARLSLDARAIEEACKASNGDRALAHVGEADGCYRKTVDVFAKVLVTNG